MSETWSERVVEALRLSRLPLDDDELARRLGASQSQTINQTCRRLEAAGVIERHVGPEGKIVNRLLAVSPSTASSRLAATPHRIGTLASTDSTSRAIILRQPAHPKHTTSLPLVPHAYDPPWFQVRTDLI